MWRLTLTPTGKPFRFCPTVKGLTEPCRPVPMLSPQATQSTLQRRLSGLALHPWVRAALCAALSLAPCPVVITMCPDRMTHPLRRLTSNSTSCKTRTLYSACSASCRDSWCFCHRQFHACKCPPCTHDFKLFVKMSSLQSLPPCHQAWLAGVEHRFVG